MKHKWALLQANIHKLLRNSAVILQPYNIRIDSEKIQIEIRGILPF